MKSLKISAFALLCTLISVAQGLAHENPRSVNEDLKDRIVQLIDHPDLSKLEDGPKYHAEIEFIVTRQNQVLVLAVYTNNTYLEEYLKEKLNYRSINLKGVQRMTPYRITVNFVKP
ncbi:MAG TPA: hypothetical protein VI603_11765 [Saprospiraceae bacterium]|nr:hypothetical protein [Saprospiraceae bacterium]